MDNATKKVIFQLDWTLTRVAPDYLEKTDGSPLSTAFVFTPRDKADITITKRTSPSAASSSFAFVVSWLLLRSL